MYLKILFFVLLFNVCNYTMSQNVLDEHTYITDGGTITIDDNYVTIFEDTKFYPWNFSSKSNEVENIYIEIYSNEHKTIIVVVSFDDARRPEYITITINDVVEFYIIKR